LVLAAQRDQERLWAGLASLGWDREKHGRFFQLLGRLPLDAIVPAYNEETTVKPVVETLLRSRCFWRVIVVDDGSTDGTAAAARSTGAEVLSLEENGGKMAAMMAGVARSNARSLAFFDADAENLSEAHVRTLVRAWKSGDHAQVCGTVDQGLMNRSKIATGQRIVLREVLEGIPCDCGGYTAETAINYLADRTGHATKSVELTGLRLRHKIDKFGWLSGVAKNARMVAGMLGAHVALSKSNGQTCEIGEAIGTGDVGSLVGSAVGGSTAGVAGAVIGGLAGRAAGTVLEEPGGPACTWGRRGTRHPS
jgi:hypothetical protein